MSSEFLALKLIGADGLVYAGGVASSVQAGAGVLGVTVFDAEGLPAGANFGNAANLAALSPTLAQLTTGPGEWGVAHLPAAATIATITRAASPGERHVCKSITVCIAGATVQPNLTFVLRDGASGAGTILWGIVLSMSGSQSHPVMIGGLNILGSAGTAMTLECTAAPAAGNQASVALSGVTTTQ